ncbi:PD-(D/E)XK nuclease family protein [Limosilactobacillus caecicola]|uniref:PD-(D/E)XK nuclease family protein n=1 Tax=Limosilactobacillus caecicola TaxID=2941332 RepID=UPI00203D4DCA|nr:PD-(D/E)XK nuclease family protein [Limosilactobacillus caecicola]
MSTLNFVLGPASKDHQQELVRELHEQLVAHPNDQFFFLVPNHIKFSTEIEVLNQLRELSDPTDVYAQSQVQVLSFTRLAWFLLRDEPNYQIPRISNVGMTMLVAKIVRNLPEDDLKMFAQEAHRYGFVQELTAQLIELQNANVDPSDHDAIMERVQAWAQNHHERISNAFLDKMSVLFKVYEQFQTGMANRLNTTAVYQQLVQHLQRNDFSHTHFFLNRYNGQFSAIEEQVVEAIIKNATSTTIGLVLDRPYRRQQLPDPHDLFYQTGMQYHRLANFADQQAGVDLRADVQVTKQRVSTDLIGVENWLKAEAKLSHDPDQQTPTHGNIHFFTAPTRVAELQRVATKIRQLVASGQYRYRDFLILARHLDGYTTMLKPVFDANEVPIFNDNDRPMANHPLVTLIEALFKIANRHFQLPDVLQLLKTGLVMPNQDSGADQGSDLAQQFMNAIYTTENWCLKYGKTGSAWLDQQAWEYTPHVDPQVLAANPQLAKREAQLTQQINWVKQVVREQVAPLIKQLQSATDGQTAATVLYQGLVNLGVDQQLQRWTREATDRGQLDLAQQPQQVWNTLCSLLDEYVAVLGTSGTFDLTDFVEILQIGFQTATYSSIPSTMDQVLVSETGIVQTAARKVVFMIGATDDVMPEVKINEGLLSDPDKELLKRGLADDQFLPVSGMQRVDDEPMVNYLGMLSGQEQLFLSVPDLDSDEAHLVMSPYMVGLAKYFGEWASATDQLKNDLPFAPQARPTFDQLKPFVGAPAATLTNYIQVERQAKTDGQAVGASWRAVSRELNHERLGWLKSSLNYQNQTTKLSPNLAAQLYGHLDPDILQQVTAARQTGQEFDWAQVTDDQRHNTLATSISQLQTFYKNPYEFFLKFGLDLQKREELEITNANSGTFYHDAMEAFIRLLHQDKIVLANLADDQLAVYVARAIDWAFGRQPSVVELADNYQRIAYQKRHLEGIVLTMARVLRNQAQNSAAHPLTTEQKFDHLGVLDDRQDQQPSYRALVYETTVRNQTVDQPDLKRKVYLRGRIDRVDAVHSDQQDYLTVVDYKSADKAFDLVDAYEGLDLQMLTYLNNLRANLDLANPDQPTAIAGALYLHLFNPHYSYSDVMKGSPEILELKRHEFKGLLLDNDDVLRQIDEGLLAEKPDPLILGVSYTKSKDLIKARKGSLLVNEQQLERLLSQNRQLIINATQQIFSGNVELRPFRREQKTGLDYSDYLDIYHFDNLLDQDKYREITLTDDDVMNQLMDKGDDHE